MRPTKQRSRSKQHRNRSMGNMVNRVFDSSGPEGKVRGTPQQIIEKYNLLARDAQLSGDRVATENFQQHSEHYTRLLAEATREQEARREAHEAQQRERQKGRQSDRRDHQGSQGGSGQGPLGPGPLDAGAGPQPDVGGKAPASTDVMDLSGSSDTGLVETPEGNPDSSPDAKLDAKPEGKPDAKPEGGSDGKPRRRKGGRSAADSDSDAGKAEAAE